MSTHIEYQWIPFCYPATVTGLDDDVFVVLIEGGASNCFEHAPAHGGRGRRSRDWGVGMIGTATDVLRQAVVHASECEGGMLQPHYRHSSPESYIRRIRRLLAGPFSDRDAWSPSLTLDPRDPLAVELEARAAEGTLPPLMRVQRETPTFGASGEVVRCSTYDIPSFLRVLAPHFRRIGHGVAVEQDGPPISPWRIATVYDHALPRS